jgi:CRP-like cAMP-binding protein
MDIYSFPKDGRPSEIVGAVLPMHFVESPQWANMQIVHRRKLAIAATHSTVPQRTEEGAVEHHEQMKDDQKIEMDVVRVDEDLRKASTVDVTFRASTDITFITWPMETLQSFLRKCPVVAAPLNSVVGADVAIKVKSAPLNYFSTTYAPNKTLTCILKLFGQTKAGEEKQCISKRIFLPLDEPAEEVIIPREEEQDGHDGDDTSRHSEEEEGKPAHTTRLDSRVPYFQKTSSFDRQNSLIAEKMWLDKRGVEDTTNDLKLAAILKRRTSLNKYEISVLLSKGRWRHIKREGTVLIRQGETSTFIGIVLEGRFSVHKECDTGDKIRHIHNILAGQMIGSLELWEAGREHVSGETTVSLEPCTFICWDCDDLRALLAPRPRLRSQMTMLVAIDLAEKFRQVEDIV